MECVENPLLRDPAQEIPGSQDRPNVDASPDIDRMDEATRSGADAAIFVEEQDVAALDHGLEIP